MDEEGEGERSNVGRPFASYDRDGDVSERGREKRGEMGDARGSAVVASLLVGARLRLRA